MDEQIARNRRRSLLLVVVAFVLLFVVAEAVNLFVLGGGYAGLVVALVVAATGTVGSYFWSDRLALAITGAREARAAEFPELVNVVEELVIASGLPRPRICVIDDPAPNAFATGRDPEHAVVAATTGLLRVMDREQLQGVMAHELSHVQNRDTLVTTLVVTVCGAIVVLCDLAWRFSLFGGSSRRRSDREGGNGLAAVLLVVGVLALILAPVGAALIQSAVSRRREQLADFSAVRMSRNPTGLRRALETLRDDRTVVRHTSRATAHLWIESPLDRKATHSRLNRLYDTHPPLDERIAALRGLEV